MTRFECPCGNRALIRHKLCSVKPMRYECPECRTVFMTEPPRKPTPDPSLPPGMVAVMETDWLAKAIRSAA